MFVLFEKKYYFCITKLATGGAARRQAFSQSRTPRRRPQRAKKARDFFQSIRSILSTLTGLEYFDTKGRATAGRGVGQGKLKRGGRCTAERTPCLFGSKMLGN